MNVDIGSLSPLTLRGERVDELLKLLAEGKKLLAVVNSANPDWTGLLQAEAEMRSQLETLFAQPVSVSEVEAVRIALQELLSLNDTLVAAIEGHRTRALRALEHKVIVRRAANAYSQSAVG